MLLKIEFWQIEREMVSFELCKEIENDVSSSSHQHRTKKKILSPHDEMNLRTLDSVLLLRTKLSVKIVSFIIV